MRSRIKVKIKKLHFSLLFEIRAYRYQENTISHSINITLWKICFFSILQCGIIHQFHFNCNFWRWYGISFDKRRSYNEVTFSISRQRILVYIMLWKCMKRRYGRKMTGCVEKLCFIEYAKADNPYTRCRLLR